MITKDEDLIGGGVVLPNHELCNIWGRPHVGTGTKIAAFVEIGDGVKIGRVCKIGAFTFIPPGVTIEDDVFVGPHVCFTNDKYPKASTKAGEWTLVPTLVKKGASIGAGSTILCGVTIGEGAMIGAGSVVTEDVPAGATVHGKRATKKREALTMNMPLGAGKLVVRRGRSGEACYADAERIMSAARLLMSYGFPLPHSVTLASDEFDRLAKMAVFG